MHDVSSNYDIQIKRERLRHVSVRRLVEILIDCRNAVLQNYGMTTLTLNKRGGITLPPAIRRRMGLDRMENPLLVVEERDGGVFLHPATAMPVRDIQAETIQSWIREDEEAMRALRKASQPARHRA